MSPLFAMWFIIIGLAYGFILALWIKVGFFLPILSFLLFWWSKSRKTKQVWVETGLTQLRGTNNIALFWRENALILYLSSIKGTKESLAPKLNKSGLGNEWLLILFKFLRNQIIVEIYINLNYLTIILLDTTQSFIKKDYFNLLTKLQKYTFSKYRNRKYVENSLVFSSMHNIKCI